MRRSTPQGTITYSFGPGPVTLAVKALIVANIATFLLTWLVPTVALYLGFQPQAFLEHVRLWQPVTYMFIHAGVGHILWNMLALWMFGVELERLWGTKFFVKFYAASGLGGAALTLLLAFAPLPFTASLYYSLTMGASGAIMGLLLAYAMYFPDRPIYMYFVFAIPAKYFVMIIGAVTFLVGTSGSGEAWAAHLGGLAGGYLALTFGRARPLAEIKYRYYKWKMNRARRKFDIYSGGRDARHGQPRHPSDWDRHVH
jgi:membrane associated rhomboid family serine protease